MRPLLSFTWWQQVGLTEHQPARLLHQAGIELLHFGFQLPDLVHRADIQGQRREINQMEQQSRTLQMLQKLDSQAGALSRPLDQTRNIGDHETTFDINPDYAKVRIKRRERVIRHLGSRR